MSNAQTASPASNTLSKSDWLTARKALLQRDPLNPLRLPNRCDYLNPSWHSDGALVTEESGPGHEMVSARLQTASSI